MAKVAFIGLGVMGFPMAGHLKTKGGHDVTVYNRTAEKAAAWAEKFSGKSASTPAEAAAGADFVFVCVGNDEDLRSVTLGENGALHGMKPGSVLIDNTTASAEVARELYAAAKEKGVDFIDAPVSGGEKGAKDAVLSIMVGGDARDVEEARPLLETVGKTVVHVGGSGSGQTVKAANQLIVATNIQALAEAVVFLKAYDVDLESALEVLGGGLAGSAVLNQKKQNMVNGSFEPGFRIDLHHKDTGIVTSAAREAGVVVPVAALVAQLMASARANGDGGLDHSALLKGVERLSGRSEESSS